MAVTLDDIRAARERISPYIVETEIAPIFLGDGQPLCVKAESLQATGSFKVRGAFNCILSLDSALLSRGVIAASAGNHAQGVAMAAKAANTSCTIVMPSNAPISKIAATRRLGAEVILHGDVYDDAYDHALEMQEKTGMFFVHAFNDERVIAGQGTIGLEIIEQMPQVEQILVPVGGGGLAAGICVAIKSQNPNIKIIGVEPTTAASMQASLKARRVVTLASAATIADGIAVKAPGEHPFEICRQYLDGIVTVDDDEIAGAILYLLERSKVVAEGAGAATAAAVLYGKVDLSPKTLLLLSGGNIDVTMISRIIDKGLARAGRKIVLKALVLDRPGQLSRLLELVAQCGVNVVSISHDRVRTDVPLGSCLVQMELETRDRQHAFEVTNRLTDQGITILS